MIIINNNIKLLLINLFLSLFLFSNVFAINFYGLYEGSSENHFVVYFESNDILNSTLKLNISNMNYTLNNLKSYSGSTWNMEYPNYNENTIFFPVSTTPKLWEVEFEINDFEYSNFNNSNINFYDGNELLFSFNFSSLEFSQENNISSDLSLFNFTSCYMNISKNLGCDFVSLNSNQSISLNFPVFYNSSNILTLNDLKFKISPVSSESSIFSFLYEIGLSSTLISKNNIIVYNGDYVKILNSSNLSQVLLSSNVNLLNSFSEGNFSNLGNSIIYSNSQGTWINDFNITKKLTSNVLTQLSSADLFSDFTPNYYSDHNIVNYLPIKSNSSLKFDFSNSWTFDPDSTCSLIMGLNSVGNSTDLILNFSQNFSVVLSDLNWITNNNLELGSGHDDSYNSLIYIEDKPLLFSNPLQEYKGKTCLVKFGVGYIGNVSNTNLSLSLFNIPYLMNVSSVNEVSSVKYSYVNSSEILGLRRIIPNGGSQNIIINNNWTGDLDLCSLDVGLNYFGEKQPLYVVVDNTNYELDTDGISNSNYKNIKRFTQNSVVDIVTLTNISDLDFFSNIENLNGGICSLDLGLNYAGNISAINLSIVGNYNYYFPNLSQVKNSNILEYTFSNSNFSNHTSVIDIGKLNDEQLDTLLINTNNLFDNLALMNSCYLRLNLCYTGSSNNDLYLNFPGDELIIPSSSINTCSNFDSYYINVDCDSLSSKPQISFSCPNCNSSNYFSLGSNIGTESSSSMLYGDGSLNDSLGVDPNFSIYTNESLNFSKLKLNISCLDLKSNLTLACPNCDSNNYLNFVVGNDSSNTYLNLTLLNNSIFSGVESYDYFDYSILTKEISCSLVMNRSVGISCPSCDENNYYSFPIFNNSNTKIKQYYNSSWNLLEGPIFWQITSFQRGNNSYSKLNVSCDKLKSENLVLTCDGCDKDNTYLFFKDLDTFGNIHLDGTQIFGNLLYDVFSNTSLMYSSLISPQLNCSLFSNGSVNISCPDCDINNHYNFILLNGSSGHSYVNNSLINNTDFKFIVSESSKLEGNGFVGISTSDFKLNVFDTNGVSLWNKNLDGFPRKVYVADFYPQYSGSEIFYSDNNQIDVYSSIGNLIYSFLNLSSPNLIVSKNSILILNSDFSYNIYDVSNNLLKTGTFLNIGNHFFKFLKGNIFSSTQGEEIVLITYSENKYYFTFLDEDYNLLFTHTYTGNLNDVSYLDSSNSLLLFSNENTRILNLNILSNGFDLYLNNSLIYSVDDVITNEFTTINLNTYFEAYINSLSGFNTFDKVPISFNFFNYNGSVNVAQETNFSLNLLNTISFEEFNGLLSLNKILIDKNIFTKGSKVIYHSPFSFKLEKISDLIDYFGSPVEMYDENFNLLGSCNDGVGSILDLGSISADGEVTGCGMGYYVNPFRHFDYFLYDSQVPVITSNSIVEDTNYKDKFKVSINTDPSFNNMNFTNIFLHKTISLPNNISDYNNYYLEFVDNIGNTTKLNYTLLGIDGCRHDNLNNNGFLNFVKANYFKNEFSDLDVYVCLDNNVSNSDLLNLNVIFSKYNNLNDNFTINFVGLENTKPSIFNLNVSSSIMWGENFNVLGNFSDSNGDNINITLEILNPTSLNWEVHNQFEGVSNGVFNFSTNLNSSYISNSVYYRFRLIDSNGGVIKSDSYTQNFQFSVLNRNISISKIDTSTNNYIQVNVSDKTSNQVLTGALCKFYLSNGGDYILVGSDISDSYGVCEFVLDDSFNLGTYYYYVVAENDKYNSKQSLNYEKSFKKEVFTNLQIQENIKRNELFNIQANIIDVNDNPILEENVDCELYFNGNSVDAKQTDSNGRCIFNNKNLGCSYNVGLNNISVVFSNIDTNKYLNSTVTSINSIILKDSISIDILSPDNSLSYDPLDEINLNLTVVDSCSNNINVSNLYWQYEELDSGDKSIISSNYEDSWVIPSDVYGSVKINAIVNDDLYGGVITNSTQLSVQDVLNIEYFGSTNLLRLPNQTSNIIGRIVTGNGIAVNESDYVGNWSNYNCSFYLNDSSYSYLGSSLTDNNGYCSFELSTNCSYMVGDYQIKINLTGNTTPEYPIFDNSFEKSVIFYDNLSGPLSKLSIDYLSFINYTEIFEAGTEYQLGYNFTDSCGNNQDDLYSVQWSYNDDNLSINLGSDKQFSFLPISSMNGNASINLSLLKNNYYSGIESGSEVIIARKAKLVNLTVPKYLLKDSNNTVLCEVDINGISNFSFYNVTFIIDNSSYYNVPVGMGGIANLEFDSTGFSQGQHLIECELQNYISSDYYILKNNLEKLSSFSLIPANLMIYQNSTFHSNREYDLRRSTPGNIIFPAGMNESYVFRDSTAPMYYPDIYYLGIGFATLGATGSVFEGQQILLDGVNVTAYIYNNDSQVLVDTISCIQDLSEFNSRESLTPIDTIDNLPNTHICILEFNPGNIPVGNYKFIVNATVPSQNDWTSQSFEGYFEIWGNLHTNIISPYLNERIFSNNTIDLTSNITDEFNYAYNSDNVSVEYFIRDLKKSCRGKSLGIINSTSDFNFMMNNLDFDEISYNGYYMISPYYLSDPWSIQAMGFGDFYANDEIKTTYRPSSSNYCDLIYLNKSYYDEIAFNFNYPINVTFEAPTSNIIAPDTTGNNLGKFTFSCKVNLQNKSYVPNFPVTLSCGGCSSIPENITKHTDSSGIANFHVVPNSSDYTNKYNFSCSIPNNYSVGNNSFIGVGNDKINLYVAEQLGSGWGNLPDDYVFPSITFASYSDASCTTPTDWFKRGDNNIYLGFDVSKGSEDLVGYTLRRFTGPSDGFLVDGNLNPNNDSKCIFFTKSASIPSNNLSKFNFGLVIEDNLIESAELFNILYVDDIAPVIENVTKDKIIYDANEWAQITVTLDNSTYNVNNYGVDIESVKIYEDISGNLSATLSNEGLNIWSGSIQVPNLTGIHDYNIEVIDKAGFEANATFNLKIDTEPPEILSYNFSTGCGGIYDHVIGSRCLNNVTFYLNASDDSSLGEVKIDIPSLMLGIYNVNFSSEILNYSLVTSENLGSNGDGSYNVNYFITDLANKDDSRNIILDIKKSSVTLSNLNVDKYYINSTSSVITFLGTISESSIYFIKNITIGDNLVCQNNQTCNINYSNYDLSGFSEGDNHILARIYDNLENTETKSFDIILDTIFPSITINNPLNNDYLKGSFNLNADVIDTNRIDSSVNYEFGICSGVMTFGSGNNFVKNSINSVSCTAGVDGIYNITINSSDLAGNKNSSYISVTIDNTIPIIQIENPLENQVLSGLNYDIYSIVNETNLDEVEYQIDSNGQKVVSCSLISGNSNNCSATMNISGLSDGSHTLTFYANDSAGNINQDSISFSVDNEPPIINWLKIINNDSTQTTSSFDNTKVSKNFRVEAEIYDEAGNGNSSTYKIYLDGLEQGVMTSAGGNKYYYNIDSQAKIDGSYNISISAKDYSLKENNIGYFIDFDNTAPNATFQFITPNLIKTGDSISYTLTANENIKDNCVVRYSDDGIVPIGGILTSSSVINSVNCSKSFSMTGGVGDSGDKYILVNIVDIAGNTANINFSFELDNLNPTVSILNPINGELVGTSDYVVNINVTEKNFDNAVYYFDSNSGSTNLFNCSSVSGYDYSCQGIINSSLYLDGNHSLTVIVEDNVSNLAEDNVTFLIDATAPIVNVYKLENSIGEEFTSSFANRYLSGNISFYANIYDEAGNENISSYHCMVNGTNYSMSSLGSNNYKCQIDTTVSLDNIYNVSIIAKDNAGWITTVIYNETFDNTAPGFVMGVNLTPSLIKTGDYMNLTLIADEKIQGKCEVYYSNNGNLETAFLSNLSISNNDSCNDLVAMNQGSGISGTRYILAKITDLAGNTNYNSSAFSLDNSVPIITIETPTVNEYISGQYLLNIKVDDLNFDSSNFKIDGGSAVGMNCVDIGSNINNCTYTINSTSLDENMHIINYTGIDLVNLSSSIARQFYVDNQPPIIVLDKVKNFNDVEFIGGEINGSYVSTNIRIFASISDLANNGNANTYKCYVDDVYYSTMNNSGANNYYCDINISSYSDYTDFKIEATDYSFNKANKTFNLIVDNIKPNFISTFISPDLIKTGDGMFMNITSNEILGSNCNVYYSNDGVSKTDLLLNTLVNNNSCSDYFNMTGGAGVSGTKNILFEIVDLAGNINQNSIQFYLDNEKPSISYFNITNTFPARAETLNLPSLSPTKLGIWEINVTDNSIGNGGNITSSLLRVIQGSGYDETAYKNFTFQSGIFYNLSETPLYFNLSNGTGVFEVEIIDSVGNVAKKNLTLYITNAPPFVENVTANPSFLEVNLASTNISINVTTIGEYLKLALINITAPNGSYDSFEFSDNITTADYPVISTGGIHSFMYTPSQIGSYNMSVYLENTAYASETYFFNDIFETIGKTTGSLNFTPKNLQISNLVYGEPYVFNLSVNFSNTGLATMRDSKVRFSGAGITTNLSGGFFDCGNIISGEMCNFNVEVSVDTTIGTGLKSLYIISDWLDSDNSVSDFIADQVNIEILDSYNLDILNSELENDNLEVYKNETLGNIIIKNKGNINLNDIVFDVYNGTLDELNFTFTPNLISNLDINDQKFVEINVSGVDNKNYNGFLISNSTCTSGDCHDFIYLNLSFFEKINQDITNLVSGSVFNRSDLINNDLPFNCTVKEYNSHSLLTSYPVDIIKSDSSGSSTLTTLNSSNISGYKGRIDYLIDTKSITPGEISLECSAHDSLDNFLRSSDYGNNKVNITLLGKLITSLNYIYPPSCINKVYWYDTSSCDIVNLSVNVVDEFGHPISDANVSLYSNANDLSSIINIGSCVSDLVGNCIIEWNPDLTSAGVYNIYANTSLNKYYFNNSLEKNITIYGGYNVEIISPSDSDLNYGDEYNFDLIIKDQFGNDITNSLSYNTSWELYNLSSKVGDLSINKSFNWTVNNSYLGDYFLNLTIELDNETINDINSISIYRDTLYFESIENQNYEIFRDGNNSDILTSLINITLKDSSTNFFVSNANISFMLDSINNIGNCITDNVGVCNISWNPSINLDAGIHNISIFANKNYYREISNSTSNLIKVYIEPIWLTSDSYIADLTNAYTIPLSCEVREVYKTSNNPLDVINTTFYKYLPGEFKTELLDAPSFNLGGNQYVWNSLTGVLNQTSNLEIRFNNSINISIYNGINEIDSLSETGFEEIIVNFINLSLGVNWSLYGLNSTDEYELIINNSNNLTGIGFINYSKVYNNFRIEFFGGENENVIFENLFLEEIYNKESSKIGKYLTFANEFSGSNTNLRGDFESFVVASTPGFDVINPDYVSLSSSVDYAFDGEKSMLLNVSSLPIGDQFGFKWSSGSNFDLSSFTGLNFVIKNPELLDINLTLQFATTSNSCTYIYNLGVVNESLYYPNINLSEFKDTCGDSFEEMRFKFKFNGPTSSDGGIYIDRIETISKVNPDSGISTINFHPFEEGVYRFGCFIDGNTNYVVKTESVKKQVQIINSGSDADSGISSGAAGNSNEGEAASKSSVITFETGYLGNNYIVPKGGLGLLENIEVYNYLLSSRNFNISVEPKGVLFIDDYNSNSNNLIFEKSTFMNSFNIYINSSNVSNSIQNFTVTITDKDSNEEVEFPIELNFVDLELNISSISKQIDLLPLENIEVIGSVKYNNSFTLYDSLLENFTYNLYIENRSSNYECSILNSSINNGFVSLNCILPFIDSTDNLNTIFEINFKGEEK